VLWAGGGASYRFAAKVTVSALAPRAARVHSCGRLGCDLSYDRCRMFASGDRAAIPLSLPQPRYFFSASAWVLTAILIDARLMVVSARYPRHVFWGVVLGIVMASLTVGWIQALLTYRRVRASGESSATALIDRYGSR
jgi:hypothetical protein